MMQLSLFIKQYFTELEQNLVASQSINKQQPMVEYFKALMQNVERSLNGKNRDRYGYPTRRLIWEGDVIEYLR
jgi:hypothetical protein